LIYFAGKILAEINLVHNIAANFYDVKKPFCLKKKRLKSLVSYVSKEAIN